MFLVGAEGVTLHSSDGQVWDTQPSGTTERLRAVWGSSPSDVTAVGYGGAIVHYDGAAWTPEASGTEVVLHGVWISPEGEAFAVGDLGTILHRAAVGAPWESM